MPLLEAVHEDIAIEEGDDSEDGDDIAIEDSNTELARQPRDEESLPESGGDNESDHGFRDLKFLSAFDVMIVVTAALARPKSLGILSRTYHVLETGGRAYSDGNSNYCGPSIRHFRSLRTIVKRLVELHKTFWSSPLKIFSRIYRMLSLLEGLSYYHILDHLAWQAGLLSRLFRWIGWAAYAFGVLLLSTDKIGSFFVRRGLAYASATPESGSGNAPRWWHSQSLLRYTTLLFLPVAMICNSYLYAVKGLTRAAHMTVWTTPGVWAILFFDVLVYWAYFFWAGRHTPSAHRSSARMSWLSTSLDS